jgi:hypothetical protein
MKFAALLILFGAGAALAACGGGRHTSASGGITMQAVITQLSGGSTVVRTLTQRVSTTRAPAQTRQRSMAMLVESGYRACLSVPKPLVKRARTSIEARRRLAIQVLEMLASIGRRNEQAALLAGCLRALKLPALPTGAST